jgi:4-hydroxy-3-polyprenylbenzoate decarboxylase
MMLDGRRMTGLVLPSQHIGQVWQEWVKIGEPMPYALVQGGDPGVPFVGGIPLPARVDEVGYLGALYCESVEVTRCETSDLYVPASAEVVIEGHVSTERAAVEGPFGEYAGYMPTHTSEQPIFSVEAITHRDHPIWPLVAEGRPVDETHTVTGTGRAVALLGELRAAGLPITTVWTPLQSANHWTVITVPAGWRETLLGLDTHEFVHRIGKVIDVSRILPVSVFVLDDDIDPSNEADLSWALATRIHPHYDAEPWFRTILPLMNSYSDREKALAHGPMVVHDGLQPAPGAGRPVHSSFAQAYPPEIRQRVLAHWLD